MGAASSVGVTGTNGKTSTASFIAEVLRCAGRRVVCETTVGSNTQPNEFVPPGAGPFGQRMQRFVDAGVEHFVLETTSEALAHGWAKRWRFDVGVFTNLSHDHLNAHGSAEHYLASKAQLFVHLSPGGTAVLNANDVASTFIERVTPSTVRRLYFSAPSRGETLVPPTLALARCALDRDGTHIELLPGELADGLGRELHIRLVGEVFAENALAAALAGFSFGLEPRVLKAGLFSLERVPGRFEVVVREPCVVVDYAHSEDALLRTCVAGRALLAQLGGSKLIVVFGAGGDRDAEKRTPMGRAVGAHADVAIVTNDNPRSEDPQYIAQALLLGARSGGRAECFVELERPRAIARALETAGKNDVVLICGKGHELYAVTDGDSAPRDDVDCVRRLCGLGVSAQDSSHVAST
ncbi:MAG TPA: UDP-N-acetylmuramyl-tripeptide synthetase [Polyangiaceae bacterium]|nr:UDP-N-acetylmuramyl-tripeptide synthetase [Polyangiaceae bacterium]